MGKKSIFYELPYWSTIKLKHNIDIMHVEKNVCDSFLGTILVYPCKSKDTNNARHDLENLGIKKELYLYEKGNKLMKATAEYTLTEVDHRQFCKFSQSVTFPNGFASKLTKNISPNDTKILGLKSYN